MTFPSGSKSQNITLLLFSTASATHLTFTTYCAKIDPEFKALIAVNALPIYPSTLNAASYPNIDLLNSAVSDMPYSIAMTTLSKAVSISLPIGAMVNANGASFLPSKNAMTLTLFEAATDGYPADQTSFDLTNPQTPQAWPIMVHVLSLFGFVGRCVHLREQKNAPSFLRFFLLLRRDSIHRRCA